MIEHLPRVKHMTLNLRWFEVRFAFWQQWSEWLFYKNYKWHNFDFVKLSVEDNYPFHGRFDLVFEVALIGLNLMIEIESTKERDEGSPVAKAQQMCREYERGNLDVRTFDDVDDLF